MCDEAARAEKRAYYKAWREKNKERVKKHNATYWQKRAAKRAGGGDGDRASQQSSN